MTAPAGATQTPRSHRLTGPLHDWMETQNASAIVLLAATLSALVWANSPWSESYEHFWETEVAISVGTHELALSVRHWVNDGLMAFFFFVAGLEIRREFDMGELRERRRVATPVLAAIGGMVVPALIYLAFTMGEPTARGWGIAMGTDTAFALGILSLVGRSASPRTRTFLLTLVIVDDIAALIVIALAYTGDVSVPALVTAFALFGVVLLMKAMHIRNGVAYFLVALGLWLATLASGVHATIAGVAVGLLASAYPPSRDELSEAGTQWRLFREQPTAEFGRSASRSLALTVSPNERLQFLFHPWTSFVIVPIFALANAGMTLNSDVIRQAATSPVTLGVVFGLVVGKPVGILVATWLATRPRLGGFPRTVEWPPLIGAGTLAGIGFTVALLIADISFDGQDLDDAKLGILAASVIASVLALVVFQVIRRVPSRSSRHQGQLAQPLIDLAEPVDLDTDHSRGPVDAPLTLVEYGDFECPYCGQAEPVIRELAAEFGTDLRFVFRHLPLSDVHEHAQLAAEASEAAGAQGRFWEMHDLLMQHQEALGLDDLVGYARQLGLDERRFTADVESRRFALEVERDVEGADLSGVAGTPTFFINGRRHHGSFDLESLTEALGREATQP